MNYFIHNFTNGYEKSDCNLRETILYVLKGYGIFSHLKDTNFDRLDQNDPKQWLWKEDSYDSEIKQLKKQVEEQKLKVSNISEEEIQHEYDNEVFRINWGNNPESNYYLKQTEMIQSCLDDYEPKLRKFISLCNLDFVNEALEDIVQTAKSDLNRSRFNAQEERDRRIRNPRKIPSYEEFREGYIERQKGWIEEFETRLEEKKDALKRIKKLNKQILEIFEWITKAENEIETSEASTL